MFKLGYLNLTNRASVETLFWHCISRIRKIILDVGDDVPEELEPVVEHIHDNYFCNFSIFQSAPDHWAVKQLFPIIPIQRLNEETYP